MPTYEKPRASLADLLGAIPQTDAHTVVIAPFMNEAEKSTEQPADQSEDDLVQLAISTPSNSQANTVSSPRPQDKPNEQQESKDLPPQQSYSNTDNTNNTNSPTNNHLSLPPTSYGGYAAMTDLVGIISSPHSNSEMPNPAVAPAAAYGTYTVVGNTTDASPNEAAPQAYGTYATVGTVSDDSSTSDRGSKAKTSPTNAQGMNAEVKKRLKEEQDAAFPFRDWNGEYQQLIEMPQTTSQEKLIRTARLFELVEEFTATVEKLGSIILSEIGLPDEHKRIHAADVGGAAGGEKYFAGGIFFKVVYDINLLYGGDAGAMKAAAHELRGLRSYVRLGHPKISTPLMILMDTRGLRLAAATMVPIGGK